MYQPGSQGPLKPVSLAMEEKDPGNDTAWCTSYKVNLIFEE